MLRGNRSHVAWLKKKKNGCCVSSAHIRSSIDLLALQLRDTATLYSHVGPSRWLWKISPVWENSRSETPEVGRAAPGPLPEGVSKPAELATDAKTPSVPQCLNRVCVVSLLTGSKYPNIIAKVEATDLRFLLENL